MSEFSPSVVTANAALHPEAQALTPEGIESVLSEFRCWLQEVAAAGSSAPLPAKTTGVQLPPDLHTLMGQFVALRHEINLQTKAARTQQEQNAETLRKLDETIEALSDARTEADAAREHAEEEAEAERLRPLLKTLVDVNDSLGLARRELLRGQKTLWTALERLPDLGEDYFTDDPGDPTFSELFRMAWVRFWRLGRRRKSPTQRKKQARSLRERQRCVAEITTRVRGMLDSLVTGYTMSLQRAERALSQNGLERIPCKGQSFDPEQMEVVDAVSGSGRPAGEVIEEIRPGYLWRGRMFRYAQVQVAKGDA